MNRKSFNFVSIRKSIISVRKLSRTFFGSCNLYCLFVIVAKRYTIARSCPLMVPTKGTFNTNRASHSYRMLTICQHRRRILRIRNSNRVCVTVRILRGPSRFFGSFGVLNRLRRFGRLRRTLRRGFLHSRRNGLRRGRIRRRFRRRGVRVHRKGRGRSRTQIVLHAVARHRRGGQRQRGARAGHNSGSQQRHHRAPSLSAPAGAVLPVSARRFICFHAVSPTFLIYRPEFWQRPDSEHDLAYQLFF